MTKTPHDLAKHLHRNGTLFIDKHIIDMVTAAWGTGDLHRLATRDELIWEHKTHPGH